MKPRILLCLALALSSELVGCSTSPYHTSSVSPVAQRILQRMSDYYDHLGSFEGTSTIIYQSPTFRTTTTKQFAFVRPNKFVIRPNSTNDWQWICDGTNFYDYRPFYFNSYTKTPAPARFDDVITNWIGGALVHLMVSTNRFRYVMNGFGWGMVTLSDEGNETVDGVRCCHLLIQEGGLHTAELWIATGVSPFILKYAFRFPATAPATGVWTQTETISGWRANASIPVKQFAFLPLEGAIEHSSDSDTVEVSTTLTNGVEKRSVKFHSSVELDNMKKFLKTNGRRFQAVALKAILDQYTDLTTNDLAFSNIEPDVPENAENTFVVTYSLPKAKETTHGKQFIDTKEQTIEVTLKHDGTVESVSQVHKVYSRSE